MEIYRITKERYVTLTSSGFATRWNLKGVYVIYAAQSRSLAVLENLAHRPGLPIGDNYVTMVIEIPDGMEIDKIDPDSLPDGWNLLNDEARGICQTFGSIFVNEGRSAVLQVPSVIVPQEFNYVINLKHPEFDKIKIKHIEPFQFDSRIFNINTDEDDYT